MISKFEELHQLFEEINSNMSEKVHFIVIGGAMLLYHGIKPATKDIDVVVTSPKDFLATENVLKKLKFQTRLPTIEYKRMNLSQIFVRDDFRIDLFHKTVCNGFALSDSMQKRVEKIIQLKYLTISLCSFEDVFLFKTFTEREGDLTDCIALAQRGIDWNIILEELQKQIKISDRKVWITWIGERLDILSERGLEIPIMSEMDTLREEYMDDFEKRHKES
ncbi:hypothetical protein HZC31_04905 [Candidatus Woesearchaeota archaeon]|nr:hypothetical protein [Candidatus Woesearchaeota archaeon]